jgi:hypothetical protein
MSEYDKPLPKVNGDNEEFWKGCREHELRFQKCIPCGHLRWPAAVVCPTCLSRESEWIRASGRGTVYTFAVYHAAFHPGFERDVPYVVATIALEEGPHLLSNVVGCRTDQVACGMPVEVTWQDITREFSLPKFRPAR